ncbi:sensor histidine kinase [Actinoplanes hulinensis]|uniref:histidine kinase n=1 Tax=Actinoplanes hulinensis TaxID=1144547 RepID=A0ABS7BD45_9ACTN|nr:sensor histidine kinase [Actinoplanes hulinensis]MBW6438858.1 sensor histidine kinase [Actinoplanes hulinensis]
MTRAYGGDAAVAAVLIYLIGSSTLDPPGPAWTGAAAVAWLAAAAIALPLVVRRRWPLPVLTVVVTAATIATATGVVGLGVIVVTWFPVTLALYTAATATGRITVALALAVALAAPAVTIPWLYLRTGVGSTDAPGSEVPLWWQVELGVTVVALVSAWAIGRLVRWRRALQADAARRLARDAVADERLRIARELHDIVGHSLSLIAVKATVANHIAEERPAETRAALLTIERTSRSALTEIRRLLDVLRADDDADGGAAELAPAPGAADLTDLVERLRSTGLLIDLEVSGTGELPTAVGLTVYRIVQESLTNVIKHAEASRCRVAVRAAGYEVRIEVTDDGRGRQAPRRRRGGQGLIGMRERVSMYGGSLSTDTRQEGGFRVVAVVPYTAVEETV